MSGDNLSAKKHHDYLLSEDQNIPYAPGLAVLTSLIANGTISDNHGNELTGRKLHCRDHDKTYILTDEQWKWLNDAITPLANAEDRQKRNANSDNKVHVPENMESPLEIMHERLEKNPSPCGKHQGR